MFHSIMVDLFTLMIARLNPPQIFDLKRLVLLIFLGHHIIVFFTFLRRLIYLHAFNLDFIINLSKYLANSLG